MLTFCKHYEIVGAVILSVVILVMNIIFSFQIPTSINLNRILIG